MYHPAWNKFPNGGQKVVPNGKYLALNTSKVAVQPLQAQPLSGGAWDTFYDPTVRRLAGAAAAYHGYKRTNSVFWALVWAACGYAAPPWTAVIAVAQGFPFTKKG